MGRYEINPHALAMDCASVQGFCVVQGDDQIRTGEHYLTNDSPSFDPELGYRLASLADGEGCFAITRRNGKRAGGLNGFNYATSFIVKLRSDDRAFLEVFHEATGVGHIYDLKAAPGPGRNSRAACSWQVSTIAGCSRIVEIFDAYPLWSKKQNDYAIWREAVLLRKGGSVTVAELEALYDALKAVRVYREVRNA